jgi:hypothetical protein
MADDKQTIFREYLDEVHKSIFKVTVNKLFSQLDVASNKVKELLSAGLKELAQKVEVNLSILWEDRGDTPEQLLAQSGTRTLMLEICRQVGFWQRAQELGAST